MESHGHRSGQGPGGSGPDDGKNLLTFQNRIESSGISCKRILNPHTSAGMVLVFDLGFGQGGFVMDAPVDRAQPFVHESLLEERIESGQYHRLILRRHGGVRIVKSSKHADSLELFTLQVQIFFRVLAAFRADIHWPHLELFAAELLVDLDLDGQTVAVPSWNEGRVKSRHGFGLNDEIL